MYTTSTTYRKECCSTGMLRQRSLTGSEREVIDPGIPAVGTAGDKDVRDGKHADAPRICRNTRSSNKMLPGQSRRNCPLWIQRMGKVG